MRKLFRALSVVLAAAIMAMPATAFAAAGEWTKSSKHNYEVRLDSPDGGTFAPGSTIEIKFSMKNQSTKGTTVSAYLAADNWGRYATAQKNAIQSVTSLSLKNGVRSFKLTIPNNAPSGSYRLWVEVTDKGSSDSGPEMFTYLQIQPRGGTNTAVPAIGWKQVGDAWYYYSNSRAVTGWQNIGGTWYFFETSGKMKTGWYKNSHWYYFDSQGKMKTGWLQEGKNWYYFKSSGVMASAWNQINGSWYYFNSTGKMHTGWMKSGGSWYYCNSSGKMLTGNVTLPNGERHRFASSGVWLGAN